MAYFLGGEALFSQFAGIGGAIATGVGGQQGTQAGNILTGVSKASNPFASLSGLGADAGSVLQSVTGDVKGLFNSPGFWLMCGGGILVLLVILK